MSVFSDGVAAGRDGRTIGPKDSPDYDALYADDGEFGDDMDDDFMDDFEDEDSFEEAFGDDETSHSTTMKSMTGTYQI